MHDSLTGLFNRMAIMDLLSKEIARKMRHGGELAVGMCDIDHFKKINDTYGHKAGDDVLRGFSRLLLGNLREYDYVSRIGGEEFLLVLPSVDGKFSFETFERLREKTAQAVFDTDAGGLRITVSIGAADSSCGNTADELIAAADSALYRAKRKGRNKVEYFRALPEKK
jgi:two-component system, cell cycle response regulator